MTLEFTAPAAGPSPLRNRGTGLVATVDLGGGLTYGVDVQNAVWELHRPWNSSSAILSPGVGDVAQSFTPDVPGRYLVKAEMDLIPGPGTVTYAALYEVESAYIKDHAEPAATESTEANLPSNEGWGTEMNERVSRVVRSTYGQQGLVMALNTTGSPIPAGTPVKWFELPFASHLGPSGVAVGTPPDWLGQVEPALATSDPGVPVGIAMETIANGDRGYVQFSGPWVGVNTTGLGASLSDVVFANNAGALSLTPGDFPIPIGYVAAVGPASGSAPGIIVLAYHQPAFARYNWPLPRHYPVGETAIYANGVNNNITVFEAEMLVPGGANRWNVRRFECVTAGHHLALTWHILVPDRTIPFQRKDAAVAIRLPYQLDNAGGSVEVTVLESTNSGAASTAKTGSTVSASRQTVEFTWAELDAAGLDLSGALTSPQQYMEIRADVTLALASDVGYVGGVDVLWGD